MDKEILEITKKFHDTYEKLASEYTYETREDTKVFDINSNNGKLMYAVVNEIVSPILKENQELKLELSGYRQAILNNKEMLGLKEKNQELKQKYLNAVADYETTMAEKEKLNSLVNSCQEEIRQLKKQLEERKYYKFYKYENNPNGSNYCFCERPCDSNMSLKCFFENGEICGFMSETLVNGHDNIEEISLNEFAHDFIKPLINANFQNKNQQKEFIKYLEDMLDDENDIFSVVRVKDVLQKHKEIIEV